MKDVMKMKLYRIEGVGSRWACKEEDRGRYEGGCEDVKM